MTSQIDPNDLILKDIFYKKGTNNVTTIIDIKNNNDKNYYYTSDYLEPGSISLINKTIEYTSNYDNKQSSFNKQVLILRMPTSKHLSRKSLGDYTNEELTQKYKTTSDLIKNINDVSKELSERLALIMKVSEHKETNTIKFNIDQIKLKSGNKYKNIFELNGKVYSISSNSLINVLDSCQCKIMIHISSIYSTQNGNIFDIRLLRVVPKNIDNMPFLNKKMLFDEFNENTNNNFSQLKRFESFDVSDKVFISKKTINNKIKKILNL